LNKQNLNFAAVVAGVLAGVCAVVKGQGIAQAGEGWDWAGLLSNILPAVGVVLVALASTLGVPANIGKIIADELIKAILEALNPSPPAPPTPTPPAPGPLNLRDLLRDLITGPPPKQNLAQPPRSQLGT
jgi:hypothetical protein